MDDIGPVQSIPAVKRALEMTKSHLKQLGHSVSKVRNIYVCINKQPLVKKTGQQMVECNLDIMNNINDLQVKTAIP